MAVTSAPVRGTLAQGKLFTRGRVRVAWLLAALLALWSFVAQVVSARVSVLGPFDDGILFTTVTYLLHGHISATDFYQPYGIGLGVPGVVPHLLGYDGAFALRLTYGAFPPLVTFLVTLFVWRRCGWRLGLVVGLVSISSTVPRYSMGFAALFCFALMVERLAWRTETASLREVAARSPRALVVAGAVLSLAGWARSEYAVFALLWAAVLAVVLRGSRRWQLPLLTAGLALLPTLIVLATGGATHLGWILRYYLSRSSASFSQQRGTPITLAPIGDRISELFHLQLDSGESGWVVGSYGVAAAVLLAALCMLLVPRWRARLVDSDPTCLAPFMVAICAVVLYGQSNDFTGSYGMIGNPVFWAVGALLVRRLPGTAILVVALVLVIPLVSRFTPDALIDQWQSRPATTDRPGVPGMNYIPIAGTGAPSMSALTRLWHRLRLDGRPTVSVELRNDVAWGNDSIVGFLLNAPPAAWPLTYDPGLVNRDDVERGTVHALCQDRAPVVQLDHDYPYPTDRPVYVGSRTLDEFLAVDYGVHAVAGIYRILLPTTSRCVLPRDVSDTTLASIRDRWIREGQPAEAGAIAVALMDRALASGRGTDRVDAAIAALGGYDLRPDEVPPGGLGFALEALNGQVAKPRLAAVAASRWPSDLEALAVQTAWIANRTPPQPDDQAASAAVLQLALRHPAWPQAIVNLTAVVPHGATLIAQLARSGAVGVPAFDTWRRDWYIATGRLRQAVASGLALIADYNRVDDPLNAAQAELTLAGVQGLDPGCAALLKRSAAEKPGTRIAPPKAGPPCVQPEFAGASL